MSGRMMRIKPAPGLLVRDYQTKRLLAADGEDKPRFDQYWQRRLRDGDVVLVEQTEAARAAVPVQSEPDGEAQA